MVGNSATEFKIMKFTFKEIVFALIFGGAVFSFALWQGKQECEAKLELFEAKQKLKETADKLVDALEEAVKKTTPKWEVTEGEKEWKITDGEKEWVYPKHIEFIYSESTKPKSTEQWKTITMRVTAYCPCNKCCDQWADIPISSGKRKTASGHTIHVGDKFVAAPRNYPFGTEMVIEGYAGGRVVKVEDVGGAIKGNKLDLYFDSHNTALQFGRRRIDVKVKILK